ncbi:acyl-CoA dehydrogenase C-terminal domain-containing protein [Pusillimonas sp. CC-YST705]|uniref:Acyl-CoA dehydrogenase C-terminal domain-containing protein n=1 Tax=Mesopusillimonas faecipullorum TaxID=2755040 RepID=A0ABS8CGV9_9BURK|nr:acyl-CoA dehydrogenase C-terminal domain-containing protein [Mesopusillimonas faecipullorum]MCB5364794.1 acyl-CoA dehydrogenase C-terminal domain-containing protein [Mesopusillimonas faecipullorum]
MLSYQPPLKDIEYVLGDLLDAPATLQNIPAFAEMDKELMMQVLEEAGRFASEVVAPLNAPGDEQGCRYQDGQVKTPDGFAQAYAQFCEAGWPALPCHPEYGGQGLPNTLNCILYEMLSASNHAWTMFPGLLHGAYSCLHQYGSEALKNQYLPKIASGEWLATMGLTESQAGSDLGLLRTRAVMQADGSARITGSKIFISGGEHDMTENIVHLVLARLPDAPAGSKGISLFLVPKYLPEGDGLGARNTVTCTGIEHKMGLHGSATTSLQFDDAIGYLVGEPNRGLAAMFVMMNSARLHVGMQGLGLAGASYASALAYAQERLQSRAAVRPPSRAGQAADPIVLHPPMQRLLMTQRAYVEGGRMLTYWAALLLDTAEHHPDAQAQAKAHGFLALVTPIIKSMMTDQGFAGASQALQVFGGHGYVRETGIEQYVRDARIAMIYEGTNEIQAVDLLLRKVLADNGKVLEDYLQGISDTAQAAQDGAFGACATTLASLINEVRDVSQAIGKAAAQHAALPHLVAPDYLRLLGHVSLAWFWLRAAQRSEALMSQDPELHAGKQNTARYYFDFVLPEVRQHLQVIGNAIAASEQANGNVFLPEILKQYD